MKTLTPAITAIVISWICVATAEGSESFVAHWSDGTISEPATISGWIVEQGRGAKPSRIDAATIDGRRLFAPGNPVRILRRVGVHAQLAGPFIELGNGDILPGPVVAAEDDSVPAPHFVSVAVTNPFATVSASNTVRVRRDAIVRMVFERASQHKLSPGTVVFRDGRRVVARGMKWSSSGLRLLLGQSVEFASWKDLVEVQVLQPDVIETVLRDSRLPSEGEVDLLGRVRTRNGAILTQHCDRVASMKVGANFCHLLQPAWADNGILVPTAEMVAIAYREPGDVPLSILPAQSLESRNLTGITWPWRRNLSVHGQPLAAGKHVAELGVGTHSYSQVALDLPPHAESFSCFVGIENAARRGGCVRCKVFLDRVEGTASWSSDFLQGGHEPVRVDVSNLVGVKRLILVTEFAHDGRPQGADPLDIRDSVAWLNATVRINLADLRKTPPDVADVIPQLRGWSLTEAMSRRISFGTLFISNQGRWARSTVLSSDPATGHVAPLMLTREVDVDISNAWLIKSPGRDERGPVGYRVTIQAAGEKVPGTEGYDGETTGYRPGTFDRVAYCLGQHKGQRVTVIVTATPAKDDFKKLSGIVWDELSLGPLIEGLPANNTPIKPDVVLESVDTLRISKTNDPREQASKLADGSPPKLRHFQMDSGIDISPMVNSMSCDIDARWKRFVACIGPAGQSHGAMGPFQIWIGEKLVWQSEPFNRLTPAKQIDVRIPDGSGGKRLTLQVVNETRNHAVWANAGFMLK